MKIVFGQTDHLHSFRTFYQFSNLYFGWSQIKRKMSVPDNFHWQFNCCKSSCFWCIQIIEKIFFLQFKQPSLPWERNFSVTLQIACPMKKSNQTKVFFFKTKAQTQKENQKVRKNYVFLKHHFCVLTFNMSIVEVKDVSLLFGNIVQFFRNHMKGQSHIFAIREILINAAYACFIQVRKYNFLN